MRKFIERVREGLEDEHCFNREPLFFKVFLVFCCFIGVIGTVLFSVVTFITIPIWIIPYIIFYIIKEKL